MKPFRFLIALSFCILALCWIGPLEACLAAGSANVSECSTVLTHSTNTIASDSNSVRVVHGFFKQLFPHWKQTILLEPGESIDISQLPQKIQYMSNDSLLPLSINWQISDESFPEPGLHYLTGIPVLPEDVVLADGFDGIALWPVFRSGAGAELPVTPKEPIIYDSLIRLGENPETELDIYAPSDQYYVGEDGYVTADTAPVWNWDYSEVDVHTPGRYYITGTPSFPEGYTLACGYTKDVPVFVLPSDRIELFAATTISGRGSQLFLDWIYKNQNYKTSVLEMQAADETWEPCPSTWYACRTTYLVLHLIEIPKDTPLTLRLRYQDSIDGTSIERITEPVVITIPANIQELFNEMKLDSSAISELVNGDRDGSDSGGAKLPDIEQPIPDEEPETDSESESDPAPDDDSDTESDPAPDDDSDSESDPVPDDDSDSESDPVPDTEPEIDSIHEIVTDTYTAITGLRLKHLIASGSTVFFEKQGVSVEIPSDLLKNLHLRNTDLFEITIQQPQKNTFQISILTGGLPLNYINGTRVMIPWNTEDDFTWTCLDSDGTILSEAIYHREQQLLCITIDKPGLYFLAEQPELPAMNPQDTSVSVDMTVPESTLVSNSAVVQESLAVSESADVQASMTESVSADVAESTAVSNAVSLPESTAPEVPSSALHSPEADNRTDAVQETSNSYTAPCDTTLSSLLQIVMFVILLAAGSFLILWRWRNHDKT